MTSPNAGARAWLLAPLVAVQFLTRIPVPPLPDALFQGQDGYRRALVFFPAVGLLVGALAWGVNLGCQTLGLSLWVGAVLTVSTTALITGAFHEDGLADLADSLGGTTRARALEIMRDSRIGTFGGVALWAVLSLKVAAIAELDLERLWPALLCSHLLSRWSSLPLSLGLPYARTGEGLGAAISQVVSWRELVLASVYVVALLYALLGGELALWALGATLLVTALSGVFYRRRYGGITGDCLGASNQLVETTLLLLIPRLLP